MNLGDVLSAQWSRELFSCVSCCWLKNKKRFGIGCVSIISTHKSYDMQISFKIKRVQSFLWQKIIPALSSSSVLSKTPKYISNFHAFFCFSGSSLQTYSLIQVIEHLEVIKFFRKLEILVYLNVTLIVAAVVIIIANSYMHLTMSQRQL